MRLAEQGLLAGRVLDSGCGTGEQTLLAAAHGADAVGVDGPASPSGGRRGGRTGPGSCFESVTAPAGGPGLTFDAIIDSGVFTYSTTSTAPGT